MFSKLRHKKYLRFSFDSLSYVCMFVCVRMYVYMHICMCIHTQLYKDSSKYLCACVYVYIHIYLCMCINIYIYIQKWCIHKIISKNFREKSALNKKKTLFTSKLTIYLCKGTSKLLYLEHRFVWC